MVQVSDIVTSTGCTLVLSQSLKSDEWDFQPVQKQSLFGLEAFGELDPID